MATRQITVRNLGGESYTVSLSDSHPLGPTIAALRERLHEEGHKGLKGCKLFFNGSNLSDGLAAPQMPHGAFLVAVPTRIGGSTRHARAVRRQETAPEPAIMGVASAQSPTRRKDAFISNQGAEDLDSLLVGYAIRPSPLKRKTVEVAPTTVTQGGGFVKDHETIATSCPKRKNTALSFMSEQGGGIFASDGPASLHHDGKSRAKKRQRKVMKGSSSRDDSMPAAKKVSDGDASKTKASDRGETTLGSRPALISDIVPGEQITGSSHLLSRLEEEKALARLPLSDQLEKLRCILGSLGEVLQFLSSQHVTPTWQAVSAILGRRTSRNQHSEEETATPLSLADIISLASFAPDLLTLRDRDWAHDDATLRSCGIVQKLPGNKVSDTSKSDGNIQGWPAQLVHQVSGKLDTGNNQDGIEEGKHHPSLTLILNDPGR